MNRKKIHLALLCGIWTVALYAQTGKGTLLLNDIVSGKYAAKGISEIQTLPDGEHYAVLASDRKAILKYAYKTGKLVDTLFHVDKARETRLSSIEGYTIDSRGYRILVWNEKEPIYRRSWQANVYDYDVRRNFLKPLSDTPGKIRIPTFSPDGRMVAFVRDNNIRLKKFDYDTESQITKDGNFGKILNGISDWVYEEEFSQTNLLSWSADSRFLAFVKSDETEVPTYSFPVFDGSLYPDFHSYKYPKAGQKNSKVACYAYNIETGDTKKMDVPLDSDGYIPAIRFTGDPDRLAVMTLNRLQNNFNMYFVNPRSTLAKRVLHDESACYIDSDWILSIAFSGDHFAYVSEKDGFAHIYLYSMTGVLEKQLTSGKWDVTALYGIHPETKAVYYQSAEESPLRRSVYKIDAKGIKTRLSSETGTNRADFSAGFHYFVNNFSSLTTPTRISVRDEKGKELYLLNDNAEIGRRLAEVRFSPKTFFTFTNDTGDELNGWMIKPSRMDAGKRYPLLMVQYGGPNSQEVLDRYGMDWYYYLAEQGYVVAAVDGRGTGARGEAFRKCTYLKLGLSESDDQAAAARYLGKQSYIDPQRIAIWGWSYGGFNALMSMSRGNGIFKAGIAIAPVTDWRYYDSVYTERFMRTPNENFENYDRCSPVCLASRLQGNLLLVHGTSDDNVHIQNTMDYAAALVEAGKNFDMQVYPNKNHSLPGLQTREHLYTRIIDFLHKNN
ncbi:MAG: S9 family peptidase [Dysgonamonadaceae bacterium]|jgi:dipeptidyl-peptidase-4|nr:S9 family peptidase [Dysgonamonadaceae bacterium]